MGELIERLCQIAVHNGIGLSINAVPCCGSVIVSMKAERDYLDPDGAVITQFAVDWEPDEEDYIAIDDTFQQMLEDLNA